MGLGFHLEESFSGRYYRLDDPTRDAAMAMTLQLDVNGIRRFARDRKVTATGTIYVEGLAEGTGSGRPVEGVLTMKLFDEKRIPYDLAFEGDDGKRYRLRGQRDFFVHDAVRSLTILPASLYDEDALETARATLRFDPKTQLSAFVKSFRPRVRVLAT
jgi:hypothetical protein